MPVAHRAAFFWRKPNLCKAPRNCHGALRELKRGSGAEPRRRRWPINYAATERRGDPGVNLRGQCASHFALSLRAGGRLAHSPHIGAFPSPHLRQIHAKLAAEFACWFFSLEIATIGYVIGYDSCARASLMLGSLKRGWCRRNLNNYWLRFNCFCAFRSRIVCFYFPLLKLMFISNLCYLRLS